MGTEQGWNGSGEPLAGVRVLVVEDETDDARFALEAVEDLGMDVQVEVTPYGGRALELIEERRIDCVLLDYRLPRMDGIEFVRELRDRGEAVPVVVLTGRGSEQVAEELFSAGVDAYLRKDEDDEQVRETLRDVLEATPVSR